MSLNHIVAMGRLTRDPELRYTQSGKPVASFSIAVDRDYQKDATDFISCVAWGKTGEFVHKYFFKGKMIVVSGSLQSRNWEDRDGSKRTSWEINAQNVYFGDSNKQQNDSNQGYGGYGGNQGYGSQNVNADDYNDGYSGGEPAYAPQGQGFQNMGYGSEGTPFAGQGYEQQGNMWEELNDDGELPF